MISIVTPIYGCTGCLEELCDAVRSSFDRTQMCWELILVDDRGPDDPWPLICELSKLDRRVRGIRLSRNHGQHLAIWAGLAEARGTWVAVIDCDMQDDPEVLPELHAIALKEEVEAVIVDRGNWQDSVFRRFSSRIFFRMLDLLSGASIQNMGNFGIYSRRMVDQLLQFREQEVFLPIMVQLTGLKIQAYRLDRSNRVTGESSYTLIRLLRLAAAIIVRFSNRPLKISVVVGLIFSFLAAIGSLVVLVLWLANLFSVPGWASTVLSVWFLSGLILATLGIHGIYLGRVFEEVKMRPRIIIEAKTKNGD